MKPPALPNISKSLFFKNILEQQLYFMMRVK